MYSCHCNWIDLLLLLLWWDPVLCLKICKEEGPGETEKLQAEEEATQDQSSGFLFQQWEGA